MLNKGTFHINYKTVAKGQDVKFNLKITNPSKEDVQITRLHTSCGCLNWEDNPARSGIVPIVIPAGHERIFVLRLDTIKFRGEQKGKYAEVDVFKPSMGTGTTTIHAEGYIRSDIVLQPGSANFGSVAQGTPAEQRISLSYAGRDDWKLLNVKLNNPSISVEPIEKSRGNGVVNYDLVLKLKESAPIGLIRDQLSLVTDDANSPNIVVQVEGRVEPEFVVIEPNYGAIVAGKPVEKTVVIRNTRNPPKPFKILKLERTHDDSAFKVRKSTDAKTVHNLGLTFTPPNAPGLYEEEFSLTISDKDEPITFKVRARIQSPPK
jgi:hypothetical protein